MTATARRLDPSSSHEAAARVNASGSAQAEASRCLDFVKREPGLTSAEYAKRMDTDRYMPARRLADLRAAGKVYNPVGKRKCTVTGTLALTWRAVPQDGQTRLF